MTKNGMLLALAVVSAAVFVLPSMAMAVEEDIPLHVVPKPTAVSKVAGGKATLQTASGTTVSCNEVVGTATWESSTTGKLNLTYKNGCIENLFGTGCTEIKTTELPFHLVTLAENKPAMLMTSNAGHFVTFICGGGLVTWTISGNGIIGTITGLSCGAESTTATVNFEQTGGVQKHRFVKGTATDYHIESSINKGAKEQSAHSGGFTMTFEGKKKLECT